MTDPTGARTAILLVDDEPRILAALRSLLRLDYDVTTCTDGYEALELLARRRFDIIVSDQRMPTITGVQFLRIASEVSPLSVRILLTGYSDMEAIVGAINDVEIHRFLHKPWENEEIRRVMAEAAATARALREDGAATQPQEAPVAPAGEAGEQASGLLPAASSEASLPVAARDAVLLVGADPSLEQQVCDSFTPQTEVFAVSGDAGCMTLLEARPCSVLVYVLDMGNAGQRAFLMQLKQAHPQILVIVLSDSADADHLVELINLARIHRFIRMPAQFAMVRRYVESALQLASRHRDTPALLQAQAPQAAIQVAGDVETQQVQSRMQRIRRAFLNWRHREPAASAN